MSDDAESTALRQYEAEFASVFSIGDDAFSAGWCARAEWEEQQGLAAENARLTARLASVEMMRLKAIRNLETALEFRARTGDTDESISLIATLRVLRAEPPQDGAREAVSDAP